MGMLRCFMSTVNLSLARCMRKSELKGPQYEMKAVASEQLPTRRIFYWEIIEAPFFQRSFSSISELIKVSAILIFFLSFIAFCSN